MSGRQTPKVALALRSAVELRQERAFATSYLSLTSGWSRKHRQDLELIVAGLPVGWTLEDRLVAHFLPDLKASIFAFHHGAGPDLYQLVGNTALVERMDFELACKLHDALSALWIEQGTQAYRPPSRAIRTRRKADDAGFAHHASPDVVVILVRGVPLVSLSLERQAQWSPERCNQALALCTALFAHQVEFFSVGFAGIKPLTVRALADELGVHESTASRSLAGVVAATPHGLVPVCDFFGSYLRTVDDNVVSTRAVKELIRQLLIADAAAFTDAAIVAKVRGHGVILARRTVAKYRAQLGLPTASERRRVSTPPVINVDGDG